MANSIAYAQKFLPIIDAIYKMASVTNGMDAATKTEFTGTNEVKVLKVSTTGLGNYSRTTGYPEGDVTAAWETMKLTEERGKEISIDRMDDEETLGKVFGTVTGDFMRLHVVPELDAYRFAKYASTSGILTTTGAALTKDTIIGAIDEGVKEMDAAEMPIEGRQLFINSDLKPVLYSALNRQWGNDKKVNTAIDGYNDMPITFVPSTRFYTAIELASGTAVEGTTDWGYKKATAAKNINFMIIQPKAIMQVVKMALPKIFTPDENQDKDAWKFQFRLYHDAFVYENAAKGIYLHKGGLIMLVYKGGIYHNIAADDLNDYKAKGYEEVIPDIAVPEEKLTCPVCGKQYASEKTLKTHIEKEHPEFAEPPAEV